MSPPGSCPEFLLNCISLLICLQGIGGQDCNSCHGQDFPAEGKEPEGGVARIVYAELRVVWDLLCWFWRIAHTLLIHALGMDLD